MARSLLRSPSNSASAAKMPNTRRPAALVVSIWAPRPASTRDSVPGTARVLKELDTWTKVRWMLRVFAPGLVRDELAVHVHSSEAAKYLADYHDIERVELVRFFLFCASAHGYTVAPARDSRTEDDVGTETVRSGGGTPSSASCATSSAASGPPCCSSITPARAVLPGRGKPCAEAASRTPEPIRVCTCAGETGRSS